MTDAKHEAPAEGAGVAAIAKLFNAVEMADDYNRLSNRPKRLAKDFLLDSELRDAVSSLRARSSAPEARGGEAVAWKFRNLDLRQVGVTMDRREADRKAEAGWEIEPLGLIVQPAAPSADKLRIAVEALEYIDGRKSIAPVWVQQRVRSALAALKAESQS